MGFLLFSLCLLVLGVAGGHAAALPNQLLTFKTAGALKSNGSATRLGIYGGQSTSVKKHPYLAAVAYYDSVFLCPATIISEQWVLMAADCIVGLGPDSLTVYVGSNKEYDLAGTRYAVDLAVTHPKHSSLDYDVSLLKIDGKFKWSNFVKKAKLPTKEAEIGTEAVVVGWGVTKNNIWGGVLKAGPMAFFSKDNCSQMYADLGVTFTDTMACTYNESSVSPCYDDWSDPMIQDGTVYQVFIAVASSGSCTKKAYPAINADIYSVVDWIKKTIKDDEE